MFLNYKQQTKWKSRYKREFWFGFSLAKIVDWKLIKKGKLNAEINNFLSSFSCKKVKHI